MPGRSNRVRSRNERTRYAPDIRQGESIRVGRSAALDLGIGGKTAIVAAASKGLGKAVALALAREGASVVICARTESTLMEAAGDIQSSTHGTVVPIVADVRQPDDIKRLVADTIRQFAGVDILVTNAGGPPAGQSASFSDRDWQDAMVLTLLSTVRLCREVIPHMKKRGGGRIVNMVSLAAKQPIEGLVLSNSLRAAVIGFAKTLSNELARDNILVNSVCPGWILTDRLSSVIGKRAEAESKPFEKALAELTATIPLARCGTAEEVAGMVAFLASERASYMTGVTVQVDGGMVKGLF